MNQISATRLCWWLVRRPAALQLPAIIEAARAASLKHRVLAGASWVIVFLVAFGLGPIALAEIAEWIAPPGLTEPFLRAGPHPWWMVTAFTAVLVCGMAVGCLCASHLWVCAMRRFGVPESLIQACMLRGPIF
jgi:hypothetical protein